MVRQNPTHHVLVDFQAEGVRDLLGDAGTAEARVEALDLEDCGDQFFGRPLGSGATPGLRGKQPLIFTPDQLGETAAALRV